MGDRYWWVDITWTLYLINTQWLTGVDNLGKFELADLGKDLGFDLGFDLSEISCINVKFKGAQAREAAIKID